MLALFRSLGVNRRLYLLVELASCSTMASPSSHSSSWLRYWVWIPATVTVTQSMVWGRGSGLVCAHLWMGGAGPGDLAQ